MTQASSFGSKVVAACLYTGMTDCQEVLTDPSYHGQTVVMPCPHIGNYGAHDEDSKVAKPVASALVVQTFTSE
ncbi:MAG: hypothetical protein F4246_09490 [Rhodothermaceae bacterium]|nr:hypothetical protein [Rhodothermaceae bacterium]MYD18837.1 hypothetical protein [Rhodothermaceae bacterium]MYD57235.1 hypothetical protein [Rhodothermaceae bacterium]MYI43316.1 hypothetical protein [Rhodothermaceae bacterium]MYJ56762.1 hypothetical protein [Rhodothermaceae bacterium]